MSNVVFFNIDPDGSRNDSVIVEKTGQIYYGNRPDFSNLIDFSRVDAMDIESTKLNYE